MSRNLVPILFIGLMASFLSFSASAMQISSMPVKVDEAGPTLVAGGCGIGFHRSVYGYCTRNGYYAAPLPAPVYPMPIGACPYPYRLGPYGRCIL
jgi:hypothetical protein